MRDKRKQKLFKNYLENPIAPDLMKRAGYYQGVPILVPDKEAYLQIGFTEAEFEEMMRELDSKIYFINESNFGINPHSQEGQYWIQYAIDNLGYILSEGKNYKNYIKEFRSDLKKRLNKLSKPLNQKETK